MNFSSIIENLEAGLDLGTDAAIYSASCLADSEIGEDDKKRFLLALSAKGESANEVAAFAATFRDRDRRAHV